MEHTIDILDREEQQALINMDKEGMIELVTINNRKYIKSGYSDSLDSVYNELTEDSDMDEEELKNLDEEVLIFERDLCSLETLDSVSNTLRPINNETFILVA